MQTLTIPAYSRPPAILRCRPASVYIDGWLRPELRVVTWEVLPAPVFGRVRLVLHGQGAVFANRIEAMAVLPPVGTEVLVRSEDLDGGEFRGIISCHVAEAGEHGERLVAEAEHRLAKELSGAIASRWQLDGEQRVAIQRAKVRFNSGPDTMASDSPIDLAGRQARVFDASAGAVRWTVADALAYLLAAHVPPWVETQGLAELTALAGEIDLGEFDATGMAVGESLARIARRGGLDLRSSREGLGLVFYRPGRQGRVRSVRLQPAGRALSVAGSNLWRGRITIRRRPARRAVLALGERKLYETTLELSPGWNADLETSRWRDLVRSESPNWRGLSDVYRKWVLNEHGWYSGPPWNLAVHDFSSLGPQDFLLHRPRRLLPCLSMDRNGRSVGVVVQVRCRSDGPWRRWTAPVRIADEECAVYLDGDALPADFFQAAIDGEAQVRVTATIAADAHLTVEVAGDDGCPQEVLDCSISAAWRKVHPTSIFCDQQGLGPPAERDDGELLARLANRHAEAASTATEAELVLAWIDTSFHVGDVVERIDGRGLNLASHPQVRPNVRSVRHDFAGRQTTIVVSG